MALTVNEAIVASVIGDTRDEVHGPTVGIAARLVLDAHCRTHSVNGTDMSQSPVFLHEHCDLGKLNGPGWIDLAFVDLPLDLVANRAAESKNNLLVRPSRNTVGLRHRELSVCKFRVGRAEVLQGATLQARAWRRSVREARNREVFRS